MMDKTTRDMLEKVSETVNTAGWKVLSDDLQKKIEAIKEELTVASLEVDERVLRIAQGRILAYRDLLSLPYVVEHAFTQEKLEAGITED